MDTWKILRRERMLGLLPKKGYKLVLKKITSSEGKIHDIPKRGLSSEGRILVAIAEHN